MLRPDKIIIHHSLTKDGNTVSWDNIQNYHLNTKGWDDIGYHAGIEKVDGEYVCMYGRPLHLAGAHARGHNWHTLSFCFVGNFDDVRPDNELLRVAARRVLVPWMMQFGLSAEDIEPHRDFADKSCPGRQFDMLRLLVACTLELRDATTN